MDDDKRMVLIAMEPRAVRRLRPVCLNWRKQSFLQAALKEVLHDFLQRPLRCIGIT